MKKKNEKAYDRKVYTIFGIILVGVVLMFANACNTELENPAPMSGEKKLDHATSIYEVEFDGAKYIVVDTYRGIGICPKAGEVIWTKEVK
jgi:hypothetical protein